jgi:flagellum-specific ATP synthase
MDSLTRFAQAQREIGLAIGEPPVTRGYPPSVFSRLPHLVERAGRRHGSRGSITGFYTVLVEGDDFQDPIADATRAVVDGHIVLSRRLAEATHFPAIDVEASVNRVMRDAVDDAQWQSAQAFRRAYALYRQNEDLLMVGAYRRGANPALDRVVQAYPAMKDFLIQDGRVAVNLADSKAALRRVVTMAAGSSVGVGGHEQVA